MKRIISIASALIILTAAVFLGGCNSQTDPTKPSSSKASDISSGKYTSKNLKAYLDKFTKGKNPVYGVWTVKGINSIYFIFRNDGFGQVAMGNEASFAKLVINEKKKTLGVSFFIAIDGTYDYELSNKNNTLKLTSDGKTIELTRKNSYSIVPDAPKSAKIDSSILGWWKSDGGLIYYFGSDGVMYSNDIAIETAYTYNADKNVIHSVYDYSGKIKNDLKYKLSKNTLTVDGVKYKRYKPKGF